MSACRLVIADDHPLFRDALRLTIAQTYPDAEIAEAGSFDGLREILEQGAETDLVLLDLNMPGMQGFSGLTFLRAQFAAVPVAIIAASEEPRHVRLALELGATGYIPKSATAGEIRAAMSALLAGTIWTPSSVELRRPTEDPDAQVAPRLAGLTPQQGRVLMMLGQGLANKQIAHALGLSEATVRAHVSAVLQKLGAGNRTQAVILARRLAGEIDAGQGEMMREAATDADG